MALKFQVESHVVDAGHDIIDFLNRHPDVASEFTCGMLNAVAESNGTYFGSFVQGPAIHRHGIHVVQVNDLWAEPFHVPAHIDQNRDRPQSSHNPPDTQGVSDGLTKTVPLRDFKIGDGTRPITTNLDHVDGVGS